MASSIQDTQRAHKEPSGSWRFDASTLGPVIVGILLAAGTAAGFMIWSSNEVDARSAERQRRLVNGTISAQIKEITHDQESVAIWDAALFNTSDTLNLTWIDANLGLWMDHYFGHNRTYLLDAEDRPQYVYSDGKSADIAAFDDDLEVIAPLVARLRYRIGFGALDAYMAGTSEDYPTIADVLVIEGMPAVVGVAPIVSDTGILRPRGSEFVHVSVVFLNDTLADQIADQFQLEEARFTRTQSGVSGQAFAPIMSGDGKLVAFFEWAPDRPGLMMATRAAPALALGFALAGLTILILMQRLRRSSAALQADRIKAQYNARHDTLTGLPNRASFENVLEETLTLPGTADPVALLMLDLDRFKVINDTLGHHAGDELIRAVAQRLSKIVAYPDTLARLGGDEFAIIHAAPGGERDALQLGQRIIEAIAKPFDILGSEAFAGVSVGVALAHDGTDRNELTRMADIALYESKAGGRGRTTLFETAMSELLKNRQTIEAELREALRCPDQLSVAFQPLACAQSGKIRGAEALARWLHPRLGQVSPAVFIPVAEACGLVEALGEYVLMQSCVLGARWPGHTIAVNISPTQLRNPQFLDRVFDMLEKTGMRAADLELEITEGILLEDAHVTTEALATFRHAGIRIALDDFGTGYSSLNYLKRYPVDRIKIDRAFVSQLAPGNSSAAIVQAMITLAHALNIEVTAEGVETEEQREILTAMGCNCLQGFLLSAPVTTSVIETMFRDNGGARTRAA